MEATILDPKNDFAFKRIFGREENKDILIHFLNDVVVFKEHQPIKEVNFLPTIQEPDVAAHKVSLVDILCKDELGNQYIVEMQVAKEEGFIKRAQYYAAKTYVNQLYTGIDYTQLKDELGSL